MNAPRRWLEDADVPGNERELLQAGLAMDPPPDAHGAVWAALLVKVPPPVPPAPPPTAAPSPGAGAAGTAPAAAKAGASAGAGGAAVSAGILKSALIGAGSAVALIATYSVVAPSPPDPPPPVAVMVAPRGAPPEPLRAAPGAAAPRAALEPSATASVASGAAAALDAAATADRRADLPAAPATASTGVAAAASNDPGAVAPTPDRDALEESRLVGEARAALRDGDATRALGLLEQVRARIPGGVLAQEREVLTIEALARSGRRGDASVRAAAFLRAYPTSTLAARAQPFAN